MAEHNNTQTKGGNLALEPSGCYYRGLQIEPVSPESNAPKTPIQGWSIEGLGNAGSKAVLRSF